MHACIVRSCRSQTTNSVYQLSCRYGIKDNTRGELRTQSDFYNRYLGGIAAPGESNQVVTTFSHESTRVKAVIHNLLKTDVGDMEIFITTDIHSHESDLDILTCEAREVQRNGSTRIRDIPQVVNNGSCSIVLCPLPAISLIPCQAAILRNEQEECLINRRIGNCTSSIVVGISKVERELYVIALLKRIHADNRRQEPTVGGSAIDIDTRVICRQTVAVGSNNPTTRRGCRCRTGECTGGRTRHNLPCGRQGGMVEGLSVRNTQRSSKRSSYPCGIFTIGLFYAYEVSRAIIQTSELSGEFIVQNCRIQDNREVFHVGQLDDGFSRSARQLPCSSSGQAIQCNSESFCSTTSGVICIDSHRVDPEIGIRTGRTLCSGEETELNLLSCVVREIHFTKNSIALYRIKVEITLAYFPRSHLMEGSASVVGNHHLEEVIRSIS